MMHILSSCVLVFSLEVALSHPDDYDDNDLQYMYTDVLFDFLGPGRGRGSPDAGMMHPDDDDDDDDEFNDKINPPDRAVSRQPPFFPYIVKFIVYLPCTVFPNSPYIWEETDRTLFVS